MNFLDFIYVAGMVLSLALYVVELVTGRARAATNKVFDEKRPPVGEQEFYRLTIVVGAVLCILPVVNAVMAVLFLRHHINHFVERKTPR